MIPHSQILAFWTHDTLIHMLKNFSVKNSKNIVLKIQKKNIVFKILCQKISGLKRIVLNILV